MIWYFVAGIAIGVGGCWVRDKLANLVTRNFLADRESPFQRQLLGRMSYDDLKEVQAAATAELTKRRGDG
jgi:hypothetical protein